jgi:TP901 family phage tail tape measure protein
MSDKEVRVKITGDISDLIKKLNQIKDAFEDLGKGDSNNKAINNMVDDLQKVQKELDAVETDMDDLVSSSKKLDNGTFEDMADGIEHVSKATNNLGESFKEITETGTNGFSKVNEQMQDMVQSGEEVKDAFKKAFSFIEDTKLNLEFGGDENKSNSLFSSIAEGFISGSVAGERLASTMEGVVGNLKDATLALGNMKFDELKKSVTYFDNLRDSIYDTEQRLKAATGQVDELEKEFENLHSAKDYFESDGDYDEVKAIQKQIKALEEYRKKAEEIADAKDKLNKKTRELVTEMKEFGKCYDDSFNLTFTDNTVLDAFKKINTAIEDFAKGATNSFDEVEKEYKDFIKTLKSHAEDTGFYDGEDNVKDWNGSLYKEAIDFMQEKITYLKKYRDEIDALEEGQRKLLNIEQDYIKEFDQQEEAYTKLTNKIRDLLADEEKSVLVKEKLAKAYQKLHDAMTSMGANDFLIELREVDDLFDDIGEGAENLGSELKKLMDKAISEAEEYRKTLSLVSYDQLSKELKDFGAVLDDKVTKMVNFKQMQNEMDDSTRKAANSLLYQIDSLKQYADTTGFAVHQIDENTRALEGNEDAIKRQRAELQKNQEIIEKYFRTIKDSGKDIADRFFDENGNFNMDKYIREIETFGVSMDQLIAQHKAYGQQILESIKREKENAQAMRDSAKEAKEQAAATLENAKAKRDAIQAEIDHAAKIRRTATSMEELQAATRVYESDIKRLAEANEQVTKAQKEYEEASKKASDVDKDRIERAKDLVKAYNDQAKALRELGADIKDITKNDFKFDSSLGTMIDDIFPDDLPKNFADFKEDFIAMFKDFNSLDFGDAFDKLKELGSGILEKIPVQVKLITAALVALGKGLADCAKTGISQFTEGMGTIGNVADKVFDVFRDVGSEVKDAFENITDMDLDLGSIIEQCVEFEGTIKKTGVAAEAAGNDFEKLENKARELGATSRYSATDVATAMDELATAGWSVEDILTGIDSVVNLSEGSFMDLGKAAEFVANGLTAMNMSTNQASDLVDILSFAALKTSTDVNQMQRAFTNAASVAGTLGISAADVATALGLMADQGVKGAKAGTALKNLMANMAAPTKKMSECLKEYNLEGVQTAIVNGDLMGGLVQLKKSFDDTNLSVKDQLKVITTLAGKEALPGIAALMNNTANEMLSLNFAVESSTKSSKKYAESLGLIDKEGKVVIEDFSKMTEEQTKAYEQWENFNNILNETSDAMYIVNGSTTDLGAMIHKLGADGEVTAEQIFSILDVFDKMDESAKGVTDTLNKYGIEIARTEEGAVDFGDTLKNLGSVWDGLNDSQKQELLTQLGVKDSVEELNELFSDEGEKIEDLIGAYEKMQSVSEHLADSFDSTLKGALLELASAMEERFLQVFDKLKPAVMKATETLTEGFNIWNGLAKGFDSGFVSAMEHVSKELARQSEGWGKAISDGLHNAIKSLDKVVNGGSLDNILKIGTNIIKGIADGINKASNDGSLDRAITGAINKIATWCSENLDTIIESGGKIVEAISKGISENSDEIGEAIKKVMEMQTDIDKAIAKEKWKLIGENLVDFIAEGIVSKVSVFDSAVQGFFEGINIDFDSIFSDWHVLIKNPIVSLGEKIGEFLHEILITTVERAFDIDISGAISSFMDKLNPLNWFGGKVYAEEKSDGSSLIGGNKGGNKDPLLSGSGSLIDIINNHLSAGKVKTDQTASEIGKGISDNIVSKLETMDAAQLQTLQTELQNLQTTTQSVATGMGASFTAIQDSARTSFMGFTNIVRNQMTNCTNIIRNQALNMANAFREQFVNMSNIANNQFTNVANNIRTQMTNCSNIVRNQALNMSNIFRNQFTNMANIVRNQMVNCANIVTNQMTNMANSMRTQMVNMSNIVSNQMTNMANNMRTQMVNMSNIVNNQCTNMANNLRTQFVNMSNIINNQMTNMANNMRTQMVNMSNIVNNQCTNMANNFRTQFTNMANIARNQFVNVANIIRNQMVNCTNIVNNQCNNMANSFRTQFVNMANVARNQMVNISNIIRNQAVSWSNVIRNQVTNARNALTQQMLSMANVTRTQMVNITNIIRNQSTQWASLVQSGASRAKSSFSSSFSGLANVARNQMANCLSIVRSYMNQIAAATSKTMTMNFRVNKTTTTTNITKNVTKGARATMGNINTNMRGIAQPSTMSTSMSNGSINLAPANNGISGSLALEIPVMLDGREIARASASYTQAELAKLEMRSTRKRGN